MAATNGSPTQYQGQSWVTWSDYQGKKSDEDSDPSEDDQSNKYESDSMKLRKEDMTLFGFCPARDQFYLVVCELCNIHVKPQALQHHINIRHGGSLSKSKPVIIKPNKSSNKSKIININNNRVKSKKNHVNRESIPVVKVEKIASNEQDLPSIKHSSSAILPSPQQPPPPDPGKEKLNPEAVKAKKVTSDVIKVKSTPNSSAKSRDSSIEIGKTISISQSSISLSSLSPASSSSSKKLSQTSNVSSSASNPKRSSKTKNNKERKLLLCKGIIDFVTYHQKLVVLAIRIKMFSEVKDVKKNAPNTRLDTFCDMLTNIAMHNVDAGEFCAVDEALVLWKGRLGFRQFIKTKRARFGIKLFVFCNSERAWFGYNYNFCIYYGKDNNAITPEFQQLSKSERIVAHLGKSILGQGRHIFVDNWYASTRLAAFLDSKNTMLTGTIRPNRGLPKEITDEKLERYHSSFIRKDNSLVVKWEDKKSVHVITTCYSAGLIEKDKTYFGGVRKVFKKPYQIEKYNEYMGSVDMADQLLEPYDPSRKSHAWFKKLGLHLVMRMLLNSFLVYRNTVDKGMKFRKYIEKLVEELLVTHNKNGKEIVDKFIESNPRAGRKKKREQEEVVHALVSIPQAEGSSVKRPTKRCRICYPTRKQTRTICIGCPDKPGLCSIEHFKAFHGRQNTTSDDDNQ
ncbi:PiggyBac transposable element-derived protein 4 [Nymphon striatum]|nr:PiggyBac transposable element-derived protein 4 [Nymphon striatum]